MADDPVVPHPDLPRYYENADSRPAYVRRIFDETAAWYDVSTSILSLGSGRWYRSKALERAGLKTGMKLLDLATGTGAVAEAAHRSVADLEIIGADVSAGMLSEVRRKNLVTPVQATGESLPFADGSFEMISVGFAMRHFADLRSTFREMFRVLRPGGRIVILEITPPSSRIGRRLLELYMKQIIPTVARFRSGEQKVREMLEYYWDTTIECVPPNVVLGALREAGFLDVSRHVEAFINSEYTGMRPAPGSM